MKKLIFPLSILFLFPFYLFSQTDSSDSDIQSMGFVMPEVRIYTHEGNKEVIYHFKDDYNLFSLSHDSIKADPYKFNYQTSIHDVSAIGMRNGTYIAKGMLFGAITGFIAGVAFGIWQNSEFTNHRYEDKISSLLYGVFFTMPFMLIGELVGFATPKYEKLKLPRTQKLSSVINVLSKYGYGYEMKGDK